MATLKGTSKKDKLRGTGQKDTLLGQGADDSLYGKAGNDTLKGGTGNDKLYGGTGNDKLYGEAGTDQLLGSSGNDKLYGGAGNDTLKGGAGNDLMNGGSGNDIYFVTEAGDRLADSGGIDEVRTGLGSFTLSAGNGIDRLVYTGTGSFAGTGNEIGNTLIGGLLSDTLSGGAGNDRLEGSDGNDVLDGGAGADAFIGGEGTDTVTYAAEAFGVTADMTNTGNNTGAAAGDTYISIEVLIGSSANDVLTGGAGGERLFGGNGDDRLAGGLGSNELYGGAGNDRLDSGAGIDLMDGGEGSDEYRLVSAASVGVGDAIADAGSSGTDFISFGTAGVFDLSGLPSLLSIEELRFDAAQGVQLAAGTFQSTLLLSGDFATSQFVSISGAASFDGSQFQFNNWTNTDYVEIFGTGSGNTLTGTGGRDLIYGGGGIDTITGASGNDEMDGGDLGDIYVFQAGDAGIFTADTISDTGASGIDQIALADGANGNFVGTTISGIEQLHFMSFAGSQLAQFLSSQFGAGLLDPNLGVSADGAGDQVIVLTSGNFSAAGFQFTGFQGASVEVVILGGSGAEVLTGSVNTDEISGNGGVDTLNGGRGDDQLSGGADEDIFNFTGNTGAGTFSGFDSITDFEQVAGAGLGDEIHLFEGLGGNDWTVTGSGSDTIFQLHSGITLVASVTVLNTATGGVTNLILNDDYFINI